MAITDLDEQIKKLTSLREEAVERVKKFLGTREQLMTESFNVRYTRYTQSRFSTKEFKESYPEMYKDFLREVAGTRFSYSRRIDESKEG